jgi:PiT family inorganic phosphate transporter
MGYLEIAIIIVILGLLFDYTNGFHDAANVVSTMIATRALAPMTAILFAAILNTFGATQIGGVAKTISTGLLQEAATTQAMIVCALCGAIGWNFLTWYCGLPSSSSYALVGGLIGAAMETRGWTIIQWHGVVFKVLIPMVISPFIGFGMAYLFMKMIYKFFGKDIQGRAATIFRYLQIGSGGLVALSHGLNDAQKSMGVITLGLFASGVLTSLQIPWWVIIACALVMGLGTATGGYRIIRTVGFKITQLSPPQGVAAELSASCVILIASFFGMPISSSQMIVGGIGGVGVAKSINEINKKTIQRLVVTWICTLPCAAGLSAGVSVVYRLF